MDLPVVLIKFREYIFWFGPAYLIATGLGAAVEVVFRRLLRSPIDHEEPEHSKIALLYRLWWHATGLSAGGRTLPARLYIWLALSAHSLSWLALLMTAAFSWPVALLRIGLTLILISILSALLPLFIANRLTPRITMPAESPEASSPSLVAQWWQTAKARFGGSSNAAVIGCALGGAIIGLTPSFYAILGAGRGIPSLSYFLGPAIGTLTMLIPGLDVPILAALHSRNLDAVGIGLMLGVSIAPWRLLRLFKNLFGSKVVLVYLAAAWLMAAVAAWLLNLIVPV